MEEIASKNAAIGGSGRRFISWPVESGTLGINDDSRECL
jgi:hypothetical protein